MTKKIFKSLIGLVTLASPMALVVSCGHKTNVNNKPKEDNGIDMINLIDSTPIDNKKEEPSHEFIPMTNLVEGTHPVVGTPWTDLTPSTPIQHHESIPMTNLIQGQHSEPWRTLEPSTQAEHHESIPMTNLVEGSHPYVGTPWTELLPCEPVVEPDHYNVPVQEIINQANNIPTQSPHGASKQSTPIRQAQPTNHDQTEIPTPVTPHIQVPMIQSESKEPTRHPIVRVKHVIEQGAYYNGKDIIYMGDRNDRYQIGSSSKSFTASAIFQLIDKGVITLDSKMSDIFDKDYQDKFKGLHISSPSHSKYLDFSNVTIRQLLTHTSGLADYLNIPGMSDNQIMDMVHKKQDAGQFNIDSVISIVKDFNNKGTTSPGTSSYSNTGYYVLGNIIEKLSGKAYYEYIQDNIFTPLNLNHSSFDYSDLDCWYQQHDTNWVDKDVYYSAGAIASNMEDMIHFGLAIQKEDNRLMSRDSFFEWKKLSTDLAYEYGAGLMFGGLSASGLNSPRKYGMYTHAGQTLGYQSDFVIDKTFIYVASVNDASKSINEIINKFIQEFPQQ